MTKEELINGKYWLVTTEYPYQGCYTYDIIKSNSNPEEHSYFNEFIVPDLCEACFEEYGYIDYPDEESYDNISDYQEALDWWESNREDISVIVELITEDLIEKLGKDYYLWDKSEQDYDLTK